MSKPKIVIHNHYARDAGVYPGGKFKFEQGDKVRIKSMSGPVPAGSSTGTVVNSSWGHNTGAIVSVKLNTREGTIRERPESDLVKIS